jgi:hypothetical protein
MCLEYITDHHLMVFPIETLINCRFWIVVEVLSVLFDLR